METKLTLFTNSIYTLFKRLFKKQKKINDFIKMENIIT